MGKFSDKFLSAFSLKDEDDEFDEYDEKYDTDGDYDEDDSEKSLFGKSKKSQVKEEPYQAPRRSNSQEVCIFKPASIEDSREITETLLQGKAVVINFEGLHVEISQRIIDFISGSCYALDGNLQKISNYIFIATPPSVDISGDFQELFDESSSSFDISGFKSPLL